MKSSRFIFIFLLLAPVKIYCDFFDTRDIFVLSDNTLKDSYFSYSLLLRKGDNYSEILVAAPKAKNIGNESRFDAVYKCPLYKGGSCGLLFNHMGEGRSIESGTVNGNFFGMAMDGDSNINGPLVACAPRTQTIRRDINFFRGYCIYMRNTSDIVDRPVDIVPLGNAGRDTSCCDSSGNAFYDLGFAMAGFDVSFYSEKEILFGAPGILKFNGKVISYSLENPRVLSLLPHRNRPVQKEEDSYFGYSVTSAVFQPNTNNLWFVAGAPRAENLKGKVTIYYYDVEAREKMNIVTSFEGDEAGSYFGASILAVDVTNDRAVDMFIGAPMTAGKTWDEGSVYFYKGLNERSFLRGVKLTGSSKMASRFGSAIVSLGDFDLDGCNDVAISAPYEDDGRGAVYIYKGSPEGITEQFSQRLSPADFNIGGITVKGFGLGISKGNDIDGNGHNDIAIGAYKSDQVFILKSYSIIDYQILLVSEINSIINDTREFNIKFCLRYTKRSEKNILRQVEFRAVFEVDYRSEDGNINDSITADLGRNMCKKYDIRLKQMAGDITPFQINLRLDTKTENIIAHGEKSLDIQIPYSHGCGDDNICNTDLSIDLKSDWDYLILGLDKHINIKVMVNNDGEPAYQCEVNMELPEGIELRDKDCVKNNRNYTCWINERLIGSFEKDLVFDVKHIAPDASSIEIRAEVTSLGTNNPGNRDKTELALKINRDSTPYIIGKSTPENTEMTLTSHMEDVEVEHQFSVGKNGPSPLQVDVDVLVPYVEQDGESIFNVVEIVGTVDNIQIACSHSLIESDSAFHDIEDLTISLNRTILVSCGSEEKCMTYSCKGEYLYDSGELVVFKIKTIIKSSLLAKKYLRKSSTKDLVAFVPMAFQKNPNNDNWVGAAGLFLIFVNAAVYIPLWVYLLAPTIGVILLILIFYGLYRCHFFDRVYKDKLEQEKILCPNDESIEEEIFDDVVFRPMEENMENKQKEYF